MFIENAHNKHGDSFSIDGRFNKSTHAHSLNASFFTIYHNFCKALMIPWSRTLNQLLVKTRAIHAYILYIHSWYRSIPRYRDLNRQNSGRWGSLTNLSGTYIHQSISKLDIKWHNLWYQTSPLVSGLSKMNKIIIQNRPIYAPSVAIFPLSLPHIY